MASVGFSRRWLNPGLRLVPTVALALGIHGAAQSRCTEIIIEDGRLDQALMSLARQTGADIATSEAALGQVRVRRIAGCLAPSQALSRLTDGSGYRAIAIGNNGFRIVRARTRAPRMPAPPPPSHTAGEVPDIIVTGTKQQVALLRFPGSAHIVDGDSLTSGTTRAGSMDDFAQMSPIMQKTELGVGRNKLFIRGISDSSFNGPTQSTATVYFGDVQLKYAGTEPAPRLADMERIEVLEGPQETLYGAGAISGIVRLTPRPVDLDTVRGSLDSGISFTKHGEPGFDLGGMLNVPIVEGLIGIRAVGYRVRDGGYIDDKMRGLDNVNRTETVGGRIALRVEPGDGWSIDTGLLSQRIDAADAGYAETFVGPLQRRSAIAQPYFSNIDLYRTVIRKSWDSGLEMVSSTGVVRTRSSDTFDATRAYFSPVPLIYQVDDEGLLISHETRFSRTTDSGISWVAGGALIYDRDAQSRVIGQPSIPTEIVGVTNTTRSASLFGEATFPLLHYLSVTLGGRGTIAQTQGEPSITPREQPSERGFPLRRVQPAFGLSWLLAPRLAAFARFQSGYRTGGIAVARGLGRIATYRSDSIIVGELGLRMERSGTRGLAFSTAVSGARWKDIQADLFSRRAQPYTDNIGDADILAVEASGDWIPVEGLRLSFAGLFTENRTSGDLAGTSTVNNRHLPNTPPFSGDVGVDYRVLDNGTHRIELSAALRYVGRSVLGTGNFLDLPQGDFATGSAAAVWRWRNVEATVNIDNVTNVNTGRFAMGNPLTFGFRDQTVPVRPRSLRIGLAVAW